LTYSVSAFLATEIVLTSLNKKYLLGSAKTTLDLIRRDFSYLKSLITKGEMSGLKPCLGASVARNRHALFAQPQIEEVTIETESDDKLVKKPVSGELNQGLS
jgi:hypothetical protein